MNEAQAMQNIWKTFDDAIANAESPDMKLLFQVMKAQAELLNIRLSVIPHNLAAIQRSLGSK